MFIFAVLELTVQRGLGAVAVEPRVDFTDHRLQLLEDGFAVFVKEVLPTIEKMQKKLDFVSETNKEISQQLLNARTQNDQLSEMLGEQEGVISDLLWAVADLKKHRLKKADRNTLSNIEWTVFDLKQSIDVLMREMCLREIQCGDWSEWSACSVDCGTGNQYRLRNCTSERKFQSYCEDGEPVTIESKSCSINVCELKSSSARVCPENFHFFGGYCFLFNGRRDNRKVASTVCGENGAHLVDIDSPEKQSVVEAYIQKLVPDTMQRTGVDIDVTRHTNVKHFHLAIDGVRRKRDNMFTNWKSEIMTYFRWAAGQPRIGKVGKDYCITLRLDEGGWYLQSCNKRFLFLCEVDATPAGI